MPVARKKPAASSVFNPQAIDALIVHAVNERIDKILEDQLQNLVAGRLAALKLSGKNPVGLEEVIEKHMVKLVQSKINRWDVETVAGHVMRDQVRKIAEESFKSVKANIINKVKAAL